MSKMLFRDLPQNATFWARRKKWVKTGVRSARNLTTGEFDIIHPTEPVVEDLALAEAEKERAAQQASELIEDLVASIAQMSEADVDAQIADLNHFPEPQYPEEEKILREACFRRLQELGREG